MALKLRTGGSKGAGIITDCRDLSALADGSGDGMVYTVRRSSLLCSNFRPRIFPEKNRRIRQAGAGKSDKDAESRAGDAGKTGGTLPLWSAK